MKKKRQKRFLIFAAVILVAVVAVTAWFFLFERDGLALTILDAQGNEMLKVSSPEDYAKDPRRAYIDIVIEESLKILTQQMGQEQAREKLWIQGYTVQTAFDSEVFEALPIAEKTWSSYAEAGIAVTDLQGNLVAAYSNSDEGFNYATADHIPYGALTPLSVYMQAIESGTANWATLYEDSPYDRELPGSEGFWPENDTGMYTGQMLTLQQGLKDSVNTVSVKCLAQTGIGESVMLLREKLGLSLEYEYQVTQAGAAEKALGNIALGQLSEGVSPVDMAGYYQIFSTGGKYAQPQAVLKLMNSAGKPVYTRIPDSDRVISTETAAIMNRLLQTVVREDSTAAAAQYENLEIAGKTGTGDDFSDNWFVGLTPQYSLAVWHGKDQSNRAAELFGKVIREIYRTKTEGSSVFNLKGKLQQIVFCRESGKLYTPGCTDVSVGWFGKDVVLQQCDGH